MGRELLNWAQLPKAQYSPNSREVKPDFLLWVLRRTTCRCESESGSQQEGTQCPDKWREFQHWRKGTEPFHGEAQSLSCNTSWEMASKAGSEGQKCTVSSKLDLSYTQTGSVIPQVWSTGLCIVMGAELGREWHSREGLSLWVSSKGPQAE